MNLTIDLTADLESRLLQEAAKQGMDPSQFVVNAVRARLQGDNSATPCLDAEQSNLLEQINRGISQTQWSRYYALVDKRQANTLTEDELAELSGVSNHIEALNVHRMECLAELARLRGATLPELLDQLGIVSPPVM